MRLLACVLCLALPASGSAAATTFTLNPIHLFHHRAAASKPLCQKPQKISLSFRNRTFHDVTLRAGSEVYLLRAQHELRLTVPAETPVWRFDEMDSRHDHEMVMMVHASDQQREIGIS